MLTNKIEIYFDSFEAKERSVLSKFHEAVMKNDSRVKCVIARVMSIEQALIYQEQDVFKYALAKTKGYFTLHNMIMYAYPEIKNVLDDHIKKVKGLKFQKGCINFKNAEDFPLEVFGEFIRKSSQMDFSKIVARYKKK